MHCNDPPYSIMLERVEKNLAVSTCKRCVKAENYPCGCCFQREGEGYCYEWMNDDKNLISLFLFLFKLFKSLIYYFHFCCILLSLFLLYFCLLIKVSLSSNPCINKYLLADIQYSQSDFTTQISLSI